MFDIFLSNIDYEFSIINDLLVNKMNWIKLNAKKIFFISGIPLQIESDTRGKISYLTKVIFSKALLLFWKTHCQMFIGKENNKFKHIYIYKMNHIVINDQWCESGSFFHSCVIVQFHICT